MIYNTWPALACSNSQNFGIKATTLVSYAFLQEIAGYSFTANLDIGLLMHKTILKQRNVLQHVNVNAMTPCRKLSFHDPASFNRSWPFLSVQSQFKPIQFWISLKQNSLGKIEEPRFFLFLFYLITCSPN